MTNENWVWIRWAIRHKPTGRFMPQGTRGGYTHDEPVPLDSSSWCPRLFGSERAAKVALTWYIKGEVSVSRQYTRSFSIWGADDDPEETWRTHHVPERKRDDLEVVAMCLSVQPERGE